MSDAIRKNFSDRFTRKFINKIADCGRKITGTGSLTKGQSKQTTNKPTTV